MPRGGVGRKPSSRRISVAALLVAALAETACQGTLSHAVSSSTPVTTRPVSCSEIGKLRQLGSRLQYVTNPRTGDQIEYVVIGDAAMSNDVLVMFPGTGQVIPSWPIQMLTNKAYSPGIVHNIGYKASEDGAVSLCHDYHMVLFDYPGVGKTPLDGSMTSDRIANDVDAMLTDASATYGIPTSVVDPIGWSLGTAEALKYAFLSPVANAGRTIHNLVLIATLPGGNESGKSGGNPASCQASLFETSLGRRVLPATEAKLDLSKLIFPYVGQGPADSGSHSGCTSSTRGDKVLLSVKLQCDSQNNCEPFLLSTVADILTYPWRVTKGIDNKLFAQQREIAHDSSLGYCARAGTGFHSEGCTASRTPEQSLVDGGVCRTNDSNRDLPIASHCVPLTMTGTITVINGFEDLFIQWTYGRALVDAYDAQYGARTAHLVTYPGLAGHGVLIQHPGWTEAQISIALGKRAAPRIVRTR